MCLRFKDSRLLDSGLGTRDTGRPAGVCCPPDRHKKIKTGRFSLSWTKGMGKHGKEFYPPPITLIINNLQVFSIIISIDLKLQK